MKWNPVASMDIHTHICMGLRVNLLAVSRESVGMDKKVETAVLCRLI